MALRVNDSSLGSSIYNQKSQNLTHSRDNLKNNFVSGSGQSPRNIHFDRQINTFRSPKQHKYQNKAFTLAPRVHTSGSQVYPMQSKTIQMTDSRNRIEYEPEKPYQIRVNNLHENEGSATRNNYQRRNEELSKVSILKKRKRKSNHKEIKFISENSNQKKVSPKSSLERNYSTQKIIFGLKVKIKKGNSLKPDNRMVSIKSNQSKKTPVEKKRFVGANKTHFINSGTKKFLPPPKIKSFAERNSERLTSNQNYPSKRVKESSVELTPHMTPSYSNKPTFNRTLNDMNLRQIKLSEPNDSLLFLNPRNEYYQNKHSVHQSETKNFSLTTNPNSSVRFSTTYKNSYHPEQQNLLRPRIISKTIRNSKKQKLSNSLTNNFKPNHFKSTENWFLKTKNLNQEPNSINNFDVNSDFLKRKGITDSIIVGENPDFIDRMRADPKVSLTSQKYQGELGRRQPQNQTSNSELYRRNFNETAFIPYLKNKYKQNRLHPAKDPKIGSDSLNSNSSNYECISQEFMNGFKVIRKTIKKGNNPLFSSSYTDTKDFSTEKKVNSQQNFNESIREKDFQDFNLKILEEDQKSGDYIQIINENSETESVNCIPKQKDNTCKDQTLNDQLLEKSRPKNTFETTPVPLQENNNNNNNQKLEEAQNLDNQTNKYLQRGIKDHTDQPHLNKDLIKLNTNQEENKSSDESDQIDKAINLKNFDSFKDILDSVTKKLEKNDFLDSIGNEKPNKNKNKNNIKNDPVQKNLIKKEDDQELDFSKEESDERQKIVQQINFSNESSNEEEQVKGSFNTPTYLQEGSDINISKEKTVPNEENEFGTIVDPKNEVDQIKFNKNKIVEDLNKKDSDQEEVILEAPLNQNEPAKEYIEKIKLPKDEKNENNIKHEQVLNLQKDLCKDETQVEEKTDQFNTENDFKSNEMKLETETNIHMKSQSDENDLIKNLEEKEFLKNDKKQSVEDNIENSPLKLELFKKNDMIKRKMADPNQINFKSEISLKKQLEIPKEMHFDCNNLKEIGITTEITEQESTSTNIQPDSHQQNANLKFPDNCQLSEIILSNVKSNQAKEIDLQSNESSDLEEISLEPKNDKQNKKFEFQSDFKTKREILTEQLNQIIPIQKVDTSVYNLNSSLDPQRNDDKNDKIITLSTPMPFKQRFLKSEEFLEEGRENTEIDESNNVYNSDDLRNPANFEDDHVQIYSRVSSEQSNLQGFNDSNNMDSRHQEFSNIGGFSFAGVDSTNQFEGISEIPIQKIEEENDLFENNTDEPKNESIQKLNASGNSVEENKMTDSENEEDFDHQNIEEQSNNENSEITDSEDNLNKQHVKEIELEMQEKSIQDQKEDERQSEKSDQDFKNDFDNGLEEFEEINNKLSFESKENSQNRKSSVISEKDIEVLSKGIIENLIENIPQIQNKIESEEKENNKKFNKSPIEKDEQIKLEQSEIENKDEHSLSGEKSIKEHSENEYSKDKEFNKKEIEEKEFLEKMDILETEEQSLNELLKYSEPQIDREEEEKKILQIKIKNIQPNEEMYDNKQNQSQKSNDSFDSSKSSELLNKPKSLKKQNQVIILKENEDDDQENKLNNTQNINLEKDKNEECEIIELQMNDSNQIENLDQDRPSYNEINTSDNKKTDSQTEENTNMFNEDEEEAIQELPLGYDNTRKNELKKLLLEEIPNKIIHEINLDTTSGKDQDTSDEKNQQNPIQSQNKKDDDNVDHIDINSQEKDLIDHHSEDHNDNQAIETDINIIDNEDLNTEPVNNKEIKDTLIKTVSEKESSINLQNKENSPKLIINIIKSNEFNSSQADSDGHISENLESRMVQNKKEIENLNKLENESKPEKDDDLKNNSNIEEENIEIDNQNIKSVPKIESEKQDNLEVDLDIQIKLQEKLKEENDPSLVCNEGIQTDTNSNSEIENLNKINSDINNESNSESKDEEVISVNFSGNSQNNEDSNQSEDVLECNENISSIPKIISEEYDIQNKPNYTDVLSKPNLPFCKEVLSDIQEINSEPYNSTKRKSDMNYSNSLNKNEPINVSIGDEEAINKEKVITPLKVTDLKVVSESSKSNSDEVNIHSLNKINLDELQFNNDNDGDQGDHFSIESLEENKKSNLNLKNNEQIKEGEEENKQENEDKDEDKNYEINENIECLQNKQENLDDKDQEIQNDNEDIKDQEIKEVIENDKQLKIKETDDLKNEDNLERTEIRESLKDINEIKENEIKKDSKLLEKLIDEENDSKVETLKNLNQQTISKSNNTNNINGVVKMNLDENICFIGELNELGDLKQGILLNQFNQLLYSGQLNGTMKQGFGLLYYSEIYDFINQIDSDNGPFELIKYIQSCNEDYTLEKLDLENSLVMELFSNFSRDHVQKSLSEDVKSRYGILPNKDSNELVKNLNKDFSESVKLLTEKSNQSEIGGENEACEEYILNKKQLSSILQSINSSDFLRYDGQFKEDQLEGFCTLYLRQGLVISSQIKNGELSGKAIVKLYLDEVCYLFDLFSTDSGSCCVDFEKNDLILFGEEEEFVWLNQEFINSDKTSNESRTQKGGLMLVEFSQNGFDKIF